jgi:hypothetical protein
MAEHTRILDRMWYGGESRGERSPDLDDELQGLLTEQLGLESTHGAG